MLKRLELRNFKNWREADLTFGRVTGLFGANSSGKSSLAQFLLLLKQTAESSDRAAALSLNGPFVRLGAATDAVHAHDQSRAIEFALDFDPGAAVAVGESPGGAGTAIARSRDLAVRAEIEIHDGALRSRSLAYRVGDAEFTLERNDGGADFTLTADTPGSEFSFARVQGRPPKLPGPVKTYRFPDSARTGFRNSGFLADLEAAFEKELGRLHHLGPLREHPQRDYLWARSRPDDIGEKGERTIDAILAAQAAGETQNLRPRARRRPFSHVIAHWLRELELVEEFRVEEIAPGSNRWQAKVRSRKGGPDAMLTDVGFGVSQVLPVVTLLHYVPEGSTVLLEQPEIHLHPLAQAGLADVILHAAAHRRIQIVLESHSEHLLLRLQTRIAEGQVAADDMKLYFCGAKGGASRIEPLELDMLGSILNWPDRFMGDAFGETARAELARFKRAGESAAE